jgi:putative transcriptional regulator
LHRIAAVGANSRNVIHIVMQLPYVECMAQQRETTFGAALRRALVESGRSQVWLARELDTNPGQISRWINGKTLPRIETVNRIGELLGVDASELYWRTVSEYSRPDYDLFVSTPITELHQQDLQAHRRDVGRVVEAAEEVVDNVYWSGRQVASFYDLGAPDIATQESLRAFVTCTAYLYVQFAEMVDPSGALVELGFALGRKVKTTMIIKKGLRTPYMFSGLGIVAAKLDFLPETHIYDVDDVDEAVRLIGRSGRQLLLDTNAS